MSAHKTYTAGFKVDRPIVLIGLMGSGKSSLGRRLAVRLGLPFFDADHEIEAAAGRTISEIFEKFGEAHFLDGVRRVIARLIAGEPTRLAPGGGHFLSSEGRRVG